MRSYLLVWSLKRGLLYEPVDAECRAFLDRVDGLIAMEAYAAMIQRDPKKDVQIERDPPLTKKERTA